MTENQQGQHDKDPWGGGNKNQGPPDLDKIFKDFLLKLRGFLGDKKPLKLVTDKKDATPPKQERNISFLIWLVVIIVFVVWGIAGFYIVNPASKAVVLRFGKYAKTTNPGLHWLPRLIDNKYIVNTQKVTAYQYSADMLTKDENIVNVTLVVHYRIDNPQEYLFNVVNADESLQQATASALRQVIGNTLLDGVLTTERSVIRQQVSDLLKQILASYKVGIEVTDVVLQPAKPPEEVTDAFNDAIKAREDEQRYVKKAEAYESKVVPLAQGQANRFVQEAQAYKQQVALAAQGKTAKFNAILPVYQKAPVVTKERMYLDTLEGVLNKSSKVLVDTKTSNNLLYLPLNKWFAPNEKIQPGKTEASNDVQKVDDNIDGASADNAQQSIITQRPGRSAYIGQQGE
jgi:modulator of FtsH protease HflK